MKLAYLKWSVIPSCADRKNSWPEATSHSLVTSLVFFNLEPSLSFSLFTLEICPLEILRRGTPSLPAARMSHSVSSQAAPRLPALSQTVCSGQGRALTSSVQPTGTEKATDGVGLPTEKNQENLLSSHGDLETCVFIKVFPRRHFWEEKVPQIKDKLQNMCKVYNPVTPSLPQGPNGTPQSFSLTRPSTSVPVNGVTALKSASGWRREATLRPLNTSHQSRL